MYVCMYVQYDNPSFEEDYIGLPSELDHLRDLLFDRQTLARPAFYDTYRWLIPIPHSSVDVSAVMEMLAVLVKVAARIHPPHLILILIMII